MKSRKILTVLGARPQFVKAASVSRAIDTFDSLKEVIVHTGQHFDREMSDIFFEEIGIPPPKHHLHVHGGGHGDMTGRMLIVLEPVLQTEKPDWVMVYGDTNSTLAGALAASKLNIPVVHVESGLRSFNRQMPEEINRVIADHLASLRLCPTVTSIENLVREGIRAGVHHVGDVMYDATLHAIELARVHSTILSRMSLERQAYALATIHRAENTDDPARLRRVMDFLQTCASKTTLVFPVHPRTRKALKREGIALNGIIAIDPVGYIDMTQLLSGANAVYTDSGGVQKEAYFHRVPCVTLREETEWTETIANGWNRLWTTSDYQPRREIMDYGDGRASQKIASLLAG